MTRVRVRVAGPLDVAVDGVPILPVRLGSRRARTLLAVLAVHRARTVPAAEIAAALWSDAPPRDQAAGVATLVSRLRAVLGPDAIGGGRTGYRLMARVDLDDAAAYAAEAERRAATEPGLAVAAARRALELVAEPVLAGASVEWAEPARTERAGIQRTARHAGAAAALSTGDLEVTLALGTDAVAADPLDEEAYRLLMAAHHAAGAPGEAIAVYERLRALLADELGVDPSAQTRQLHLAVLRGQAVSGPDRRTPAPPPSELVGRDAEFAALSAAWQDAVAGRPHCALIAGEAGIGKTRLAEELAALAERTGAWVLRARCHESERSLFLQPIVDVCTPALAELPVAVVTELAGSDGPVLADLLPAVRPLLGPPAEVRGPLGFRRARAFAALAGLLVRLAARRPLLLVIDDLHHAAGSTLDFLEFLTRHFEGAALLVLAAARREEAGRVPAQLFTSRLDLRALDRAAAYRLAARHGLAAQTDSILARTSGHTLYVVEVLHALAAGSTALPASLAAAVLDRVERLGPHDADLLRSAAVLTRPFDPGVLAALRQLPPLRAAAGCEHALRAGLLTVSGREYQFAHDLVREVLYDSTPVPTRIELHRRAADVRSDRPELVGEHAAAAQDWARASRAWLVAAEAGLARLAISDAEALATRALHAAELAASVELQARGALLRGRAHDAASAWQEAYRDVRAAVTLARRAGDQRLEMAALRQCGADIPVALGLPVAAFISDIDDALELAKALGDRPMQADLQGRLAVLRANQLRFTEALEHGERAAALARASGDETALTLGLDGLKTALAYLGEVDRLAPVVGELEPLLRRRGDLFLLQWTVFESAFIPLARGDHAVAEARMEQAQT